MHLFDLGPDSKDPGLVACLREQISQHTLAITRRVAGLKLFFSFPPPGTVSRPSVWPHLHWRPVNDGGGFYLKTLGSYIGWE